jgi:hypothetical protein
LLVPVSEKKDACLLLSRSSPLPCFLNPAWSYHAEFAHDERTDCESWHVGCEFCGHNARMERIHMYLSPVTFPLDLVIQVLGHYDLHQLRIEVANKRNVVLPSFTRNELSIYHRSKRLCF